MALQKAFWNAGPKNAYKQRCNWRFWRICAGDDFADVVLKAASIWRWDSVDDETIDGGTLSFSA
ncbi:MAG: hypothetical protein KDB00_20225 [Planctomycetales bacterium]|nr:hypothetical protein [Planctomycetales bacterium]